MKESLYLQRTVLSYCIDLKSNQKRKWRTNQLLFLFFYLYYMELYNFYGKQYSYNDLARSADQGLNEYLSSIKRGNKDY